MALLLTFHRLLEGLILAKAVSNLYV